MAISSIYVLEDGATIGKGGTPGTPSMLGRSQDDEIKEFPPLYLKFCRPDLTEENWSGGSSCCTAAAASGEEGKRKREEGKRKREEEDCRSVMHELC